MPPPTLPLANPPPPGAPSAAPRDHAIEMWIGNLLRAGVLGAAAVVLLGAVFYLSQAGATTSQYRVFHSEPAGLRGVPGIVQTAATGDSRSLIQAGLLLLIATPLARVVFSAAAFARERDWLYVGITLLVLAILLIGLCGGAG